MTPSEIAEIYERRILLESHLLRLAIESLDDELADRLEVIVEELENSEEVGERLERRYQLYEALYQHADRPLTQAQVNNLRAAVGRYLLLQRVDEQHSHEAMIAHLRARDADAAVQWWVHHLDAVSKKLQDIVSRADEANPA